jgi:hypothetical protein
MSDKFGVEPRKSAAAAVAALEARVDDAEADIADHETRIGALEAGTVATPETAGSALAIGRSVYRGPSPGKMLEEDASYNALRDAFAGFTTSTAIADGDPVNVAGNNQRATGLTGITIGMGYYVSNGVLIPESGITAFVAGSGAGTWYRFVGTGDSTTSIKQAWAEPQVV